MNAAEINQQVTRDKASAGADSLYESDDAEDGSE